MKLEINFKKKTGKNPNTWSLNNMLQNNQWVNEEIKAEIKNYLGASDNDNTAIQSLHDAAKAVFRGKFSDTGLL